MQRYFIDRDLADFATQPIQVTGDQYHHIVRVMRMKVGAVVEVVDLNQRVFQAKMTQLNDKELELTYVQTIETDTELPVFVTICVGLSKGDKLDTIVQKATELGVNQIVLLDLERNIVKWKVDKIQTKRARLQKIAQEAAEQAHRAAVPIVTTLHTLQTIEPFVEKATVALVAYEEVAKEGEQLELARALTGLKKDDHILLVFGPEGGLTVKEIERLQTLNVRPCGLGPRILRAETAPLYALAAISYQVELLKNYNV